MSDSLQAYVKRANDGFDSAVTQAKHSVNKSGLVMTPPKQAKTMTSIAEADAEKAARMVVYVYMLIKFLIVLRTVGCMAVFRGASPEQRWIKFLLAVTTGPVSLLYNPSGFCSHKEESKDS